MTDKREEAVPLSDDDLDELVQSAEDDTTEIPETTETPAADAPAPKKGETETEEPERPARSPAEKDEVDEDEEDETEGAAPDEEPDPDAPPVIPGSKPFQFKASGADRLLPGALVLPDGSVTIPKAEVGRFTSTLASAVETSQQFQRYQRDTRRQLEELKAERNEKDVAADEIAKLFTELEGKTEEELWDWARAFVADLPKLKQDIRERQLTEREQAIERKAKGPEPTPEERQERRASILTNELTETYKRVAAVPAVKKWLTEAELGRIFQKHHKRVDRLVTRLDADDPATGAKKGQEIFDDAEVLEDVEIAVNLKKKADGRTPQERNTRLNADRTRGTNPIPPAPRRAAVGAAAAAGAGKDKPFTKKSFMAGDLDDEGED